MVKPSEVGLTSYLPVDHDERTEPEARPNIRLSAWKSWWITVRGGSWNNRCMYAAANQS